MGRKQSDHEIDGVKFRITMLPFGKAKSLLAFLGKKVGPALAVLAGAESLDAAGLAPALSDAIANLDEKDLDHVADVLMTDCVVVHDDGRTPFLSNKDVREDLFTGRVLLFFKFLGCALEVNYADFFAEARKFAPEKDPAAKSTTGSPA